MAIRVRWLLLCAAVWQSAAFAADIEGTVIVHHALTKWRVTEQANTYNRGAAVRLDSDLPNDPLAFERTHVAVYLEASSPGRPVLAKIEQKNRRFAPDLVVVPVGSTVTFPNLDTIFHNVFSLSKPKSFDLGNYRRGETRTVTFNQPGLVFVYCRLHPNMAATIVVTPGKWYAKPDEDGRFVLSGIPPGRYTAVAWHKSAGIFRQSVEVEEGHAAHVEFLVPLDENGGQLRAGSK